MAYNKPDKYPCPFCEYIGDRFSSAKLFEDDLSVSFMALNRRSKGAVLISPKRHVEQIANLTKEEAISIILLIKRSGMAIYNSYRPDGFHIFCNAGKKAGQSVCHMHFQIQTRFMNVDYSFSPAIQLPWIPAKELQRNALEMQKHEMDYKSSIITFKVNENTLLSATVSLHGELLNNEVCVEETNNFYVIIPSKMRTKGSIVILPKDNVYENLFMLSHEQSIELILLVRKYCIAIENAYDPIGLSVWCETGEIADQLYKHFLLEITPYHENSNYKYVSRLELPSFPVEERLIIKNELLNNL